MLRLGSPVPDRILYYGYAETSSNAIITKKGTKSTKRESQFTLFFPRDLRVLRVLRGEKSNIRYELKLYG